MAGATGDGEGAIDGVRHAVPLYSGGTLVKLCDGRYQAVSAMELDDTGLVGCPRLEQGHVEDIYVDNGFIVVDDAGYGKLGYLALAKGRVRPAHRGLLQVSDQRHQHPGVLKIEPFDVFRGQISMAFA